MAVTSIHSIRTTLNKSIQYIVDGNKTRNGELVVSNGCSSDARTATEQFAQIRACGSGRSTILAQHIIQSFAPGEITPERAQRIGMELCQKLFGNDYQYILATHIDHDHIHNHIIVNNTNMFTQKTFETEFNQGKKSERAWTKIRNISDEICGKYGLSVIKNPQVSKGKSHYEWEQHNNEMFTDVNSVNICKQSSNSWKSRLKREIDEVVKIAADFDDFLVKCRQHDIEVEYNPERVIDLKFRLDGQQRFIRSRTLGWYYETSQIKRRIETYKKVMNYKHDYSIIRTDTEQMQFSSGLQRWADLQNMKNASKIINMLTKYDVQDNTDLENKCLSGMAVRGAIVGKLEPLQKEIDLLKKKKQAVVILLKHKPVIDELKTLSGRKKSKFEKEHQEEIDIHTQALRQLQEYFPDNHFPNVATLDKQISKKTAELDSLNKQYNEVVARNKELEYCRQQLDEYIRQEERQNQQKKKNLQLE